MAVSTISSFWEYAISRQGTKLPESSFSSTLCLERGHAYEISINQPPSLSDSSEVAKTT